MYNYSLNITYQKIQGDSSDTQYRKELLQAFQIDKYDDKVVMDKTKKIYNLVKVELDKHKIIKRLINKIRIPFELEEINIFMFLFSYTNFYLFHDLLCDFDKYKKFTDENIKRLMEKIE